MAEKNKPQANNENNPKPEGKPVEEFELIWDIEKDKEKDKNLKSPAPEEFEHRFDSKGGITEAKKEKPVNLEDKFTNVHEQLNRAQAMLEELEKMQEEDKIGKERQRLQEEITKAEKIVNDAKEAFDSFETKMAQKTFIKKLLLMRALGGKKKKKDLEKDIETAQGALDLLKQELEQLS